jgi:hypothetical protein
MEIVRGQQEHIGWRRDVATAVGNVGMSSSGLNSLFNVSGRFVPPSSGQASLYNVITQTITILHFTAVKQQLRF